MIIFQIVFIIALNFKELNGIALNTCTAETVYDFVTRYIFFKIVYLYYYIKNNVAWKRLLDCNSVDFVTRYTFSKSTSVF